ncbi:hypothetical protein BRPE64_ACDS03560 [Caballeronia insecticola]|uniref:Uncharacterized protein n=1 Tax=Caballeronia insecticola TaxID=758793 RepID=R4WMK8_9BURK|nr:hypothetical protein BRPE64_ACDS03560 [Caballeronia insecticola]
MFPQDAGVRGKLAAGSGPEAGHDASPQARTTGATECV